MLPSAQRNGHDLAYAISFAGWALLMFACVLTWTSAGVTVARRIELSSRLLRCEVWLAVAVTAAMAAVTVATTVWWVALADAAPWFFSDRPVGSTASALVPQLVIALLLMLVATSLGMAGVVRAVRSLPAVFEPRRPI
jgi:drug/metabolite transporter (DMT)-like permease